VFINFGRNGFVKCDSRKEAELLRSHIDAVVAKKVELQAAFDSVTSEKEAVVAKLDAAVAELADRQTRVDELSAEVAKIKPLHAEAARQADQLRVENKAAGKKLEVGLHSPKGRFSLTRDRCYDFLDIFAEKFSA
jgi:chromosome segregation ATPase